MVLEGGLGESEFEVEETGERMAEGTSRRNLNVFLYIL